MNAINSILVTIILLMLLIMLLLVSFITIRYLLAVAIHAVKLDEWRESITPGTDVLIIDHNANALKRRVVKILPDGVLQLETTEGAYSAHHITTIYPITRTNGTTK